MSGRRRVITLWGTVLLLPALAVTLPARQAARTLTIAAASDLQTVMPTLTAGFQKATGITPTVTFGASGSLFAQIQNGAPIDVFFSADVDYPQRLIASGHAERDSLYEYGTGRLVVWTRTDTGLDVTRGLDLLRDPRVRRIAIANPDTAPYGRAAVAALRSRGVYDAVAGKIVRGENIAQAAQLAQSGNADVGLLSHSLVVGRALASVGTFSDVPDDAYPPIAQAAVVVSASRRKEAARALVRYLESDAAKATLAAFGFGPAPVRR